MITTETCLLKYEECKRATNGIPEYRDFLKFAEIDKRQFARLFGSSAYTKLQEMAGDVPNKLQLERTPIEVIMRQYGELVLELGVVPVNADWEQRGLRPTDSGLGKKPHCIKWSEFPTKFLDWITANNISGFDRAIEIITQSDRPVIKRMERADRNFSRLVKDVREWVPARRRNSEAEYKIELRKHLEFLKHELNEEFGESKYDLLVQRSFAVEIKKDPDLGEYDRLFGQVARHLQYQCSVIVLIIEATRGDKYDQFAALVDKYLNIGENIVEIVKK